MGQKFAKWRSQKKGSFLQANHLWRIYLGIIILAAIVLGIVSVFATGTVRNLSETNASFSKSISISNQIVEDVLMNYATQVFYLPEVKKLRASGELTNFETIEGMRALNSFSSVCSFVETVYLYNKDRDFIYCTSHRYTMPSNTASFADREAVEIFTSPDISSQHFPFIRNAKHSSVTGSPYVYSYILSVSDSAMMINISAEWLNELMFINDKPTCIVNTDGKILAWQNGYDIACYEEAVASICSLLPNLQDGYRIYSSTLDGKKHEKISFYTYVEEQEVFFVQVMDYEDCLGSLLTIRRSVFALLILIAAVGIFEGVTVFTRVVSPFRKISSALDDVGLVDQQDISAEQLSEKIRALMLSSQNVSHLQDALSKVMRNEAIYSFLLGTNNNYAETVEKYQINLSVTERIFPILISNSNLESYLSAIHELAIAGDGVVISNSYTILLIQTDSEEIIARLVKTFFDNNPKDWIVTGTYVTDWHILPKEYNRLNEVFNRRFLYPDTRIISTKCLDGLSSDISDLKEISKNLTAALKAGNATQSRHLIDAFFSELPNKTLPAVNTCITSIFQSVVHLYYELSGNVSDCYEHTVDAFSNFIIRSTNVNEIRQQLDYAASEIILLQKAKKQNHQANLMKEIMNIILKEYADPNLSSQYLADRFAMSSVYMNRIFKQHYGKSISASITDVRIEKACTLLRESDMIIRKVSEKCGFDNPQHFYTLFKSKMAVTPTEYRKHTSAAINHE